MYTCIYIYIYIYRSLSLYIFIYTYIIIYTHHKHAQPKKVKLAALADDAAVLKLLLLARMILRINCSSHIRSVSMNTISSVSSNNRNINME